MAAPTPDFDPATAGYQAIVDHALMTTRGVRARLDFDRDVDDQTILDCIDVAEQAPTGGNNGSRRWMVIRDQATKDRMAELYLSAGVEWVIKTAERLEGTGHQNEKLMLGAKRLGENIQRTPALVIPTVLGVHDNSGRPGLFDSVIQSAWSFMVALRARGLGTVWTTMYLNERDAVAELLELPDGVTQICLFPVAHTLGVDFKATSRRYPARDITYFDRYGRTLAGGRAEPRSLESGPGVTVETDIKARPEAIWDLVTDLDLTASLSDEVETAGWVAPDNGIDVGTTFVSRHHDGTVGVWDQTNHVAEWEPAKLFEWHVGALVNSAEQWRFVLEKVPGGTRLRYQMRFGPAASMLAPAIAANPAAEPGIIARRQTALRTTMAGILEGIRERAEGAADEANSDFPGLR